MTGCRSLSSKIASVIFQTHVIDPPLCVVWQRQVHVLGNPEAERMLLTLGSMCKSVVACRVSPAQKRLIVRLVKRGVVPTPVTLSIGDGANDVGMIQEAQVRERREREKKSLATQ